MQMDFDLIKIPKAFAPGTVNRLPQLCGETFFCKRTLYILNYKYKESAEDIAVSKL
tara:strand:- start:333 stop:500 length:168 start_codon:yes stop_codon:yes gene_type:complete